MPRIGQTMPQQYINSRLWRRNTNTYSLLTSTSQSTQRAPLEVSQAVTNRPWLPAFCQFFVYTQTRREESGQS